ncbi:putative AUT2/APG4/ATG4 cysteine peptidase [Leptomonas pyrrhocoris]|uniref:Cysteine protease n=1 Tax=Leptomonas pyrrhocoris TaxID=157538 RepID=A0A0M9G8L7_LEPPY|nr:putative AUT2/APG4/ATG4 cysteine peptidase [Leptomonas pyrrhocoris]KPA85040.1 putative AUT2/APG4/ATG4 cysteine peptidase [Leptomonas pyrrhocoris]|eukprot:XP_015663479.1 putative AUT2/APG4/ATG4 cysteine peptidase [Leptomonas pyrrhocoris]
MSSSDKVVENTPCVDSGSLFKFWFNPGKIFRTPNKKLKDVNEVVVVGSGHYNGPDMNAYVNAGRKKLLFFSYRNCFPKLPNGSTTDSRWGCLIRTTQMLCGTALLRYHCNGAVALPEEGNAALKKKLSQLFMDLPSAPLGIHKAEEMAHENSVKYASMLSPTEAAMALGAALVAYHDAGGDVPFTVCCADRNVDAPAIRQQLNEGEHVFLLIPVVLGIAPILEKYQSMMLKFFDMKSSCGIAGGYKAASFYMFGHQGKSVFFLDPHYVQTAYTSEKSAGALTGARGNLATRHFDPCMVLGFYLHTSEDFDVFLKELAAVNTLVAFPLISVSHKAKEGPAPAAAAGESESGTSQSGEKAEKEADFIQDDAAPPLALNPLRRFSEEAPMYPA